MNTNFLRTQPGITELLSPAGSLDAARAAVNAGADAIYMGGPLFSARAYAESSREDMLLGAIEYCHLRGVRVYMTLNTLMKEREMSQLEDYLRPYADAGLDGVIVQDPGVMATVREAFPELALHISTQAAVTGPRYAARLKELGAARVVPARELSLAEIRRIREATGMEIEVFAHGAMCYSYSGQCLMSSMIGGRSGNRGRCAGTCRLPFRLYDAAGEPAGREAEPYLLSMRDLCAVSRLREMIDAGVYSFKIEGRMKSPVYVAGVTSVYRKYLDLAMAAGAASGVVAGDGAADGAVSNRAVHGAPYSVDPADLELLRESFERGGSTDGYLDGGNGREMLTLVEKPAFRAHNEAIIERIKSKYIDNDKKIPVTADVNISIGAFPELTLTSLWPREISVTVRGDQVIGAAEKRAAEEADIRDKIGRFGGTDLELRSLEVRLQEGCFVPVKVLNELRRSAAEQLRAALLRKEEPAQKEGLPRS